MLEKEITFIANCDFCSNNFDTDEDNFVNAVDIMKKQGWNVFKTKGEWFHKCDACIERDGDKDFGLI